MTERPPSADQRRVEGKRLYARLLDVTAEQVADAMSARVGEVFAAEVFLAAGGPAGTDNALSQRDRDIAVITALVAQGVTGDRLESHVLAAHRDGMSFDAMTTLMTLLAQYCGYPRASLAMQVVTTTSRNGSG